MTKDEYLRRKRAGDPIETGWELVHALQEVRDRVRSHTPLWFLLNRFTRTTMDVAAEIDATKPKPKR